MIDTHMKTYYHEMAIRNRLFPLKCDGLLIGIITFFIGGSDIDKYIRDDSWSVIDDDPNGDTCYVDHIIGNKDIDNTMYSIRAYNYFKKYIRDTFPNVKLIRGNRWKHGVLFVDKRRLS